MGLMDVTKPIGKPKETLKRTFTTNSTSFDDDYKTINDCCYLVFSVVETETTYGFYEVTQTYRTTSNWDEIGLAISVGGGAVSLLGGVVTPAGVAGGVISLIGGGIILLSPEDVWDDRVIGYRTRIISGPSEVSRDIIRKDKVSDEPCDQIGF